VLPLKPTPELDGTLTARRFARRDELWVVSLDELVEQRRLGAVARVPRRIDGRRSTRACRPLACQVLAMDRRNHAICA
jgi:hypothetical protein